MKRSLYWLLSVLMVIGVAVSLTIVSFATDEYSEAEPNNGTSTATQIDLDTGYSGIMSNAADVDWYRFNTEKDYFEFNFIIDEAVDRSGVQDGWNVTIYDSSAVNIIKEYIGVKETFKTPILPYSGTFYVCVKSTVDYDFYYPWCSYNILVNAFDNPQWESESNKSTACANEIATETEYFGTLNDACDIDVFKFTNNNDYFTLTFNHDPENTYSSKISDGWNVTILKSDGKTVIKEYNLSSKFTTPILPYTGTFYVCVKSACFEFEVYSPIDCYYSVKVDTVIDETWESEDNATTGSNAIETEKTYFGTLNNEADIDAFKFTNEKDWFELTFNFDPNNTYSTEILDGWHVKILKSDGTSILKEYIINSQFTTPILPYSGTFYVCVESAFFGIDSYSPIDCYYSVKVHTVSDAIWENEQNDKTTYANSIKPGTTYKGTLNNEKDIDMFKCSGNKDFKLSFNYNPENTYSSLVNDGWKITVLKSDGKTVVKEFNKVQSFTSSVLPHQGKFYVIVEAKSDYSEVYSPTDCYYSIRIIEVEHVYKTVTTKATINKAGKIVEQCKYCSDVKRTTTINAIKVFALSKASFTYNGKVQKPIVTVKDSKGKVVSANNYTVKYSSGCKNVGKYTVTITFKGNYSGTKKLTFTIAPKGTTVKYLKAKSKAVTVNLNKQSTQTTGYVIQYSRNSKFTSPKSIKVKNSVTSPSITKLAGNAKYYVRVRTYKTVGGVNYYSSWSSAKAVTTLK